MNQLAIWGWLLATPTSWAQVQPVVPSSLLQRAQSHPQRLLRSVVQTELDQEYGQRPYLQYRLQKQTAHLDKLQTIDETQDGDVACLLNTDGKALTGPDWQAEKERLLDLREQPALQKHRQRRELEDVRHFEKFLRALPDAFDYSYAGMVQTPGGAALRLTFVPHPGYQPSDYETRMLRSMRGEVWIDARQKRIAYFSGKLFHAVDYGWGILGIIDQGGTLALQQAEVVPGVWTLTKLDVNITGRALLIDRMQEHVQEHATNYILAAPVQSYTQAVDALLQTRCGTLSAPAVKTTAPAH